MSLFSAIKRALKEVLPSFVDTPLSTRASEQTLQSVLSKLDITLAELRDAITAPAPNSKTLADLYERLETIRNQLDVALSTRASEATVSSILEQLDITLSELRDAIRGSGNKTLTDLDSSLTAIRGALASVGTDKLLTTPDNPPNFDVALSTRASEATLSGIRAQTDRFQFDANNFLRIALASDEIGIAKDSTLSDILNQLDVSLSSRASEVTVSGIKSQVDKLQFDANNFLRIALANDEIGIARDATLSSILAQLDVSLSTRASEATVSGILGQLDITLTELRDAIRGSGDKTLTDLDASLSAIRNALSSVGTDKLLTVPDNPPNFDVALSTRASEATVSGIKSQVDRLQFDSNNFLRIALAADELGLAKDSTLSAIKNALASIGADKLLTTPDNPPNLDIALSALRDALKPTRTAPVQVLSSQSIVAGGLAEFTVSASETDGFSAMVVAVKATYNSSATQGVRVRWLYSPDGLNFDSVEEAETAGNYEDVGLAAGSSRVRTVLIPLFMPYVKVQVVNLDLNYPVTVDAWRVLMR